MSCALSPSFASGEGGAFVDAILFLLRGPDVEVNAITVAQESGLGHPAQAGDSADRGRFEQTFLDTVNGRVR